MNVNFDSITPAMLSFLQKFVQEERLQRFEEILHSRTRRLTVVLENNTDDHNTNAVIRSCEGFGLQDVHIIDNGSKFKPAKKVMRSAHKWMTLHRYKDEPGNTLRCIEHLRASGYQIIATTSHTTDKPIAEIPVDKPIALFFGHEHDGVSELIKSEADAFAIIPMHGFTESFNLSVAAAIMVYELSNRIRQSDVNWHLSEEEKFALRVRWTIKSIYRPDLIIKRYELENEKA